MIATCCQKDAEITNAGRLIATVEGSGARPLAVDPRHRRSRRGTAGNGVPVNEGLHAGHAAANAELRIRGATS